MPLISRTLTPDSIFDRDKLQISIKSALARGLMRSWDTYFVFFADFFWRATRLISWGQTPWKVRCPSLRVYPRAAFAFSGLEIDLLAPRGATLHGRPRWQSYKTRRRSSHGSSPQGGGLG